MQAFGVTCPNPVAPLLSVSYQFRHVTLEILSKILDILYVKDGTGRWVHQPSIETPRSPDLLSPRLEHVKPWYNISLLRRYAWFTKHACTALPCPADPPGERALNAVLPVYLSLAVLQRETRCAWAYINASSVTEDDYERLVEAWRIGVVDSWMRYASAQLGRCPDAFFNVLRPRVADACTKARAGACSGFDGCVRADTDADRGAIWDAPEPSLRDGGANQEGARPRRRGWRPRVGAGLRKEV